MSYSKRGEAKFISRPCKGCESTMILPQWKTKKFCSGKCFTQFHHSKWTQLSCLRCTASYSVNPFRSRLSKFCSKTCQGKFFSGDKSCHYRKDRTTLKVYGNSTKDRRSSRYFAWRKDVWKRDNFKCRIANADCNGRIEAHHILGWAEHVELRYEINNGITLCHAHHPRKRAEEKRLIPIFRELVTVSKKIF